MWAARSLPVGIPAVNRLSNGVLMTFQLYSHLDLGYAAEQKQRSWKKSQTKHLGYTAEQKQQICKKSQRKQRQQEAEEQVGDSKEKEKKLSGLDILQALEKARAQKMKKKRNGDSSLLSSRKVTVQGRKGKDEAVADDGNDKIVRPLNIKEDWGSRLDELEKRLVGTTPAA